MECKVGLCGMLLYCKTSWNLVGEFDLYSDLMAIILEKKKNGMGKIRTVIQEVL